MTSFNVVKKTAQLLVLLLSLIVLPAVAAETAATVLFSHGTVTVTNAAGGHDLNKGDSVAAGDTIHTGADGRIQMRFTDGGLVSLRPDSVFAVNKYNQPTANSEGSLAFNLIKGGLRTLSGTIGHKDHDNYQLKTSVATLGIRGTQFLVTMDGKTMRVHVGHGQISLYNEFGELLVSAGQNGQVTFGQAPELSLIVPQFGGNGSNGDDQSDQNGGDGSDLTPPDTSLTQTLPPSILLGEDGSLFSNGIAASWVTYDTNSSDPGDNGPPSSFGITTSMFATLLEQSGVDTTGGLPDFSDIGSVEADPPGTNVTGDLLWGVPNIDGGSTYFAYVLGNPTSNLPMTGTLNYSLESGYSVNIYEGATEQLTALDMTVTLNGIEDPSFQVTHLESGSFGNFYMDAPTTGSWSGAGDGRSAFQFAGAEAGANSSCSSCTLDMAGIFAGDQGAQAGVTFRLSNSDHMVTNIGAAALTQSTGSTPPVAGL